MAKKKSSGKRTTIKPKGDARYIRRDSKGRIKESEDVGRSLKKDRQKKAKKTVRSGYGDRGDQSVPSAWSSACDAAKSPVPKRGEIRAQSAL